MNPHSKSSDAENIEKARLANSGINTLIEEATREVDERKEELVKAFIAQHGCKPDEAEVCQQITDTGFRCWIRKNEDPILPMPHAEKIGRYINQCQEAIDDINQLKSNSNKVSELCKTATKELLSAGQAVADATNRGMPSDISLIQVSHCSDGPSLRITFDHDREFYGELLDTTDLRDVYARRLRECAAEIEGWDKVEREPDPDEDVCVMKEPDPMGFEEALAQAVAVNAWDISKAIEGELSDRLARLNQARECLGEAMDHMVQI